jgi:hypothetical protein
VRRSIDAALNNSNVVIYKNCRSPEGRDGGRRHRIRLVRRSHANGERGAREGNRASPLIPESLVFEALGVEKYSRM